VCGTTLAVNAALRAKVPNFILISSAAMLISLTKDISNATELTQLPANSASYYSVTKRLAEDIVFSAHKAFRDSGRSNEFRATAIRPPAVYGLDDSMVAEKILARQFPFSPPNKIQCWVYVKNIVHALTLLVEKMAGNSPGVAGEVFYISDDGPFVDLVTFWNRLLELEGKGYRIRTLPYFLAYFGAIFSECLYWFFCGRYNWELFQFNRNSLAYLVREGYFKIDKAKKALGYIPLYTSDEAFMDILRSKKLRTQS
jgi:3beta-hydroxy-delta5-steroid dehydrogenase/steroid delta-isomerase